MTDKLFKVAGVSKHAGEFKVRFANDMTRVKILSKNDTDINLIELPSEMQKPAVVAYLKTTDLYKDADMRAAIDAADAKYNPAPKAVKVKAEKPVKVKAEKKAKAEKPSMDKIKARASKKAAPAADVDALADKVGEALV